MRLRVVDGAALDCLSSIDEQSVQPSVVGRLSPLPPHPLCADMPPPLFLLGREAEYAADFDAVAQAKAGKPVMFTGVWGLWLGGRSGSSRHMWAGGMQMPTTARTSWLPRTRLMRPPPRCSYPSGRGGIPLDV